MFDLKNLIPIIKTNSGCDYHRIILPLKHMGYDFSQLQASVAPKDTQLILFNRLPVQPILRLIEDRQRYGFKIIVDLDDHWELYPEHHLYKIFKREGFALQTVTALRNADAVIVTTSLLADAVTPYNSNIHVIPNALPFDTDQFNTDKIESEFIRFIYVAGESHKHDIKILTPAFEKLKDLQNAQFILAGFNKGNKLATQTWKDMENSFSLNRKLNYIRQYSKPLDCYMDHYKTGDISLIPLEDNFFNHHKSNLKVLEAGCKNIPVIASGILPYLNPTDEKYVFYADSKSQWYWYIKSIMNNPSQAIDAGLALGEYVRKHYNLTKINELRTQLFNHLTK